VLIHDSYFHHNRHHTSGISVHPPSWGHAEGYGVNTAKGGWSRIYNNLFDENRHAVTSGGTAGGYQAENNLILKGGGFHGSSFMKYIHVFDVHGKGDGGTGGDAGRNFLMKGNVFQYKRTNDIRIRGEPRDSATIEDNIFARSDYDAAISLETENHIIVRHNNIYNVDGFGKYAVCDFDGDGVDDLFQATGRTWWLSGQGTFPWRLLRVDRLPRDDLRFGYFDGDNRCDILAELPADSGQWFISSGGVTDIFAKKLGDFGHPLAQVYLGRFNPLERDHRPGVTRQTTDAFWRRDDGQWFVTPLKAPADGGPHVWKPVQSSSIPFQKLAFGDFNGDGVTDVLAIEEGHWSISASATGRWQPLNTGLSDPVGNLYIANVDSDDNIDDIFKLEKKFTPNRNDVRALDVTLIWWRSRNGIEPWKVWQRYTTTVLSPAEADSIPGAAAFVGRFGRKPGTGATMIVDQNRVGMFTANDGRLHWRSSFGY